MTGAALGDRVPAVDNDLLCRVWLPQSELVLFGALKSHDVVLSIGLLGADFMCDRAMVGELGAIDRQAAHQPLANVRVWQKPTMTLLGLLGLGVWALLLVAGWSPVTTSPGGG